MLGQRHASSDAWGGGWTPQVNGQDYIVQSGNYCYSSLRVPSFDEVKKIQPSKDYHDSHSNHMSRPHCPARRYKGAHSAETGALAPGLEKSATELKCKQKFLKYKSTIHILTFNFRTFNRIDTLQELTTTVLEYNINIVCVQEHRYHHSELNRIPSYQQWMGIYLCICMKKLYQHRCSWV